jgi:hypothetical protein
MVLSDLINIYQDIWDGDGLWSKGMFDELGLEFWHNHNKQWHKSHLIGMLVKKFLLTDLSSLMWTRRPL